MPKISKDEVFCGYQSLYLPDGRALAFDYQSTTKGFKTADVPYLCMAYKIPPGLPVSVAINVKEYGWKTIIMTSGSNGFSWENALNSDEIIDDDTWRFGCTNIHNLLETNIPDAKNNIFTVIGFGFNSPIDDMEQGLYVDHVSFLSEKRQIISDNYLAPARPNGIALYQLLNITTSIIINDTFSFNATLEIIPTNCEHQIPMIEFYPVNVSTPGIINYTVERLQIASAPAEGTIAIDFNGHSSSQIPIDADVQEFELAIEGIHGVNDISISRYTLPHDKLNQYCPGSRLLIEFQRNPGDLPMMIINSSNATGDGLNINVRESGTGGLFLYPIPGHMLQTVEKTPQVHVMINSQRAACGGGLELYQTTSSYPNPCGFTFSPTATPAINSISQTKATAGDNITIYGNGFSTNTTKNFVLFGDIECKVTFSNSTTIICTLGIGQAGIKTTWVHVLNKGVADSNNITLLYTVSVLTVEPATSGLGGGIEVTISGNGFATDSTSNHHIGYTYNEYKTVTASTCNSWEIRVLFGSNEGVVTKINSTSIKCIAPATTILGTTDVIVGIYCADNGNTEEHNGTLTGGYNYDSALTPTITSITPASGSGQGGTTVTIGGTGFSTDTTAMIGGSPCSIYGVITPTSLTCTTSPRATGNVPVNVFVKGNGLATGTVDFTYVLNVTSVSSCSGSLFGGHTIAITGEGFGTEIDAVSVTMGEVACFIHSVNDTEILCTTTSAATSHYITNNAYNPDYGLGYQWEPADLTIMAGESVVWSWTGSPFTPVKRLVQVDSPLSNEYNEYGFVSESRITGQFSHTFTQPGIYYYIMEGYGHIGFRGSVNVTSLASISSNLSVTINSIPVTYSSSICGQTLAASEQPLYIFSVNDTPYVTSISPQSVLQGDKIIINVTGVADSSDNILLLNSKPCVSSTLSSNFKTKPDLIVAPISLTYITTFIECGLPDLSPGRYRILLHSPGKGWAYGAMNDSTITVVHAIISAPTVTSGSLRGGHLLSIPVHGLSSNMIGHTTVTIGNTPCPVQWIKEPDPYLLTANIMCFTLPSVDDGYSSLVKDTALGYWSLQYDFYSINAMYLGSENLGSFSSRGHVGESTPANVAGTVLTRQLGISGNDITDQSAYFAASYIEVSSFPEYSKLSSFSFDFWLNSSATANKYVILASSYNMVEEDMTKGFVLMINPCNQIELWLARGEYLSSITPDAINCSIIDDASNCPSLCDGRLVYYGNSSLQYDLPSGVWNKVTSSVLDTDIDWIHIGFGFEATNSNDIVTGNKFNCILDNKAQKCNGQQILFVNGIKYTTATTYYHSNTSSIIVGGTTILPTGINPNFIGDSSLLYPYYGSIDELCLYDHMLSDADMQMHYYYGSSEEQPIWINTEYNDGVGHGIVPNLTFSNLDLAFNSIGTTIEWNAINDGQYDVAEKTGIQFQWTGVHGLWQVTSSTYDLCVKTDTLIKEWSSGQDGGTVHVWLESGATYYFIDPVGNNCLNGIKTKITIGHYVVINWQLGNHADVMLTEGDGLLFQWNGPIPHNVIEMTSKESITDQCLFVGSTSHQLGKVAKEWLSTPTTTGNVVVSGLSVGEHYFVCSVGSHCQHGMRFTVTVQPNNISTKISPSAQVTSDFTIPWYIQSYEPLTIVKGDMLTFTWIGFHSLHQVSESVFSSCNVSAIPLYVWGEPSVDNAVTLKDLSPGVYYFICSIAGHCDSGMKIKVTVLPNDGIPVLHSPVTAKCAINSTYCSYSYSIDETPQLLSIEPTQYHAGGNLRVHLSNYNISLDVDDSVNDTTIWIGTSLCINITVSNVTVDYTELECIIPNEESGYYPVDVQFSTIGYASVSPTPFSYGPLRNASLPLNHLSPYPVFFVASRVLSIMPSSGSLAGGTFVTMFGSGFTHITENIQVLLGNNVCDVVTASRTAITCISDPSSDSGDVPLDVKVNGYPVSTNINFTYSAVDTPTITSIIGGVDISSGADITIMGSNFDSNVANLKIQFLSEAESFNHQIDTKEDCTVTMSSANSITCTAPIKSAGTYQTVIHVTNKGLSQEASNGASQVNYILSITGFTPENGSHGGGITLNVTGAGFPTGSENIDGFIIKVCEADCEIIAVNSVTEALCKLGNSNNDAPLSNDLICPVSVIYGGIKVSSNNNFTFLSSLTPQIMSVSPLLGGTGGGTIVTIHGSGFLPPGKTGGIDLLSSDIVVTIDTAVCEWYNRTSAPNDTTIICRTSEHRTTISAKITIFIQDKGYAVTNTSINYDYIDYWSSKYTWGGLEPPVEGDSVHIQTGQTVFLDISTPVLNLILIEGSLIFEDKQDLHLQAKYIFINNGRLQIGTEKSPFNHKAIITLHGNVRDPEIPIYGAKVLGVRQGELDLHGRSRNITWTRLAETAIKNTTSLTLQEPVDWIPGDNIVIAPTGKDGNETETNTVESVSSDGYTITLATPLSHTHHGVTETFENGHFIDIRAEVGLLTHNVIIQGSLQDSNPFEGQGADQYGAQIFIHRAGPHPTPIRIEHTEVRFAGQAFRLGRYAVHFHLSGNMNGSYIRHCAIHHSNNRALTAHGVHNILVEGNIAYDIKGHAFFVEDGIETNNMYLNNLGVFIRGSSSLLNTDQIPAAFWITNPQNAFIGNAAAASRAYGFWYDLDDRPSGPSFTYSVCPNKMPFGIFSNNVAHTCNEFGLRIWETYIPYVDGCGRSELANVTMYNFTSFANGIHGLEFSIIGNIRLVGFKVADNRDNGIEIQETLGNWGGAIIQDSLIISHTSLNTGLPGTGGIKTPNTPGLTVSNVTFINFNIPGTACLRACSHCKVLQGGFQVWFSKLTFLGNSSHYKTFFQWEHEVLFRDLDGTLSGNIGGWVTPNSGLHPPDYCTKSVAEYSVNPNVPGTVCTSDIYLLRMAWNNAQPLVTLQDRPVNVTNIFGTSIVPWRHYRLTHMDGYMFTFPSTYHHSLIWQLPITHIVDIMSYNAGIYSMREEDYVTLSHQFVQLPDHVSVGGNHYPTEDGEPPDKEDSTFSWSIDNTTETVTYLINGINKTKLFFDQLWTYTYEACPLTGCPQPVDPDSGPLENNQRRWSNPDSWPTGQLPQEKDDVAIASSWRMLLDITPPPLNRVFIYGELEFEDKRDYNFTANLILIRGTNAHLIIGSSDTPFTHKVIITLTGVHNDPILVLASNMILGKKAIGIFGNATIYGQPHTHTWSRLSNTATKGSTSITLQGTIYPDWNIGDDIIIASSSYEPSEAEIRTITNYDDSTGHIDFEEPLLYDHNVHQLLSSDQITEWTNLDSTNIWWGGDITSLTISPEVGLLSHNIVIQGGDDSSEPLEQYHHGCRILIGQYWSALGFAYSGHIIMDSVEIRHCGQGGYYSPRDPRYSIAFKNSLDTSQGSEITHCSIHHGYNTGIGIHTSNGIRISNNVVHRTTGSSIRVGGADNSIINNLAMMTSTVQPNKPLDNHAVDFPATYDIDYGNIVRDNAAAGSTRIAYRYTGDTCHEGRVPKVGNESMFWNNTAHTGLIALVILGLPSDCASVGGLTAINHWDYSVFSSSASSIAITHMKLAIGKVGINLNIFGPDPISHLIGRKSVSITNTLIVGSLPNETCQTSSPSFVVPLVSFLSDDPKLGVMMSSFNKKRSKMDGTGKWHLMKSYPTIDGEVTGTNMTFVEFNMPNNCGHKSYLIGNNPLSPDAVHPLQLSDVNKLSVSNDSLVFYYDPDPEWIVQEDCVDMDCDGPKHALIRDIDGSFVSTAPVVGSIVPFAELRFSNYSDRTPVTWLDYAGGTGGVASPDDVIDNEGIYRGKPIGNCTWKANWNAYHCQGLQHRMLVIESMDGDSEVRRLSPVALVGETTWQYTDLLNGPMDHGWCTYYTCLKRLSTFFTIVAMDTDYHIWMTGTLPGNMRFHLLNADDNDALIIHIWYKNPQRRDIYKNGIYIEPLNTHYYDNGAVTQLDGSNYSPQLTDHSGTNYYERETQFLRITLRGSDPVEVRTPPVVQVSLDVTVSLDDFFLYNLINNLAYVLKINPSRIRVVKIIAEDSARRRRNLLATNVTNSVTLEFGDPPQMNISVPEVPPVQDEWMNGNGESDTVDKDKKNSGYVPSPNQYNEDTPATEEQFAIEYNNSVIDYEQKVQEFQAAVKAAEEVNMLGNTVVELIQTGNPDIKNASIVGLTVIPASLPSQPSLPVIPPQFENITDNSNVTLASVTKPPVPVNGINRGKQNEIKFVIPSELVVSMEPHIQTGHLVHVAVSMLDDVGEPVLNLGLLTPWTCTASLVTSSSDSAPRLEGQVTVTFINGTAEFTRMRVDRPASGLQLLFITTPGGYRARTSVVFTVIDPPSDTTRQEVIFILEGDTSVLTNLDVDTVRDAIQTALGQQLDIDISRIQDITYNITSSTDVQVNVTILQHMSTDPPNVPTLNETVTTLETLINDGNFTVTIGSTLFTAVPGTVQVFTPPTTTSITPLSNPLMVILAVGLVTSSMIIIILSVACICYCNDLYKKRQKKKEADNNIPTRVNYQGDCSDTESLLSFRLAPIPRPRLSQLHDATPSHPNIPSDNSDTSIDEDFTDSFPQLPRIVTNHLRLPQRPPPINPFSGLPAGIQRGQVLTLSTIPNQPQTAWEEF